MNSFDFDLEPVEEDDGYGCRGRIGPFGDVNIFRPVGRLAQESQRQVILRGVQFPEALFSGGAKGAPSLNGGWLRVDGSVVGLDLKVNGVRKGARWLEIAHRERFYTYSSVNRKSQLRREGAVISIGHWKHVPKSGVTKAGCAEGEVDAVDLAIALVLEEVDTSALSSVGAQLLAPWGLLFGRQRDGGSA